MTDHPENTLPAHQSVADTDPLPAMPGSHAPENGDVILPHVDFIRPPPADCSAMIDIGSFFDRFGALRLKILASDDATVRAIVRDAQARKWIQLDHPDTAQAVHLISAAVPELTPEVIAHVLAIPVQPEENFALRRQYFPGN